MKLYPLTFQPVYKDYLWGGRNLASCGKKLPPEGIVAESWEVSAHPNGESIVAEGPLAGKGLAALTSEYGDRLLGKKYAGSKSFPLLVKLIDARAALSVQVHPTDEYAREKIAPTERGKNESWYVVSAAQGATLVAGTAQGATRASFEQAVAEKKVATQLNTVSVKEGDFVFIRAGLVHAIGAGLIILEIQQSSDTTYRVYDYDRVGADGKLRPLHLAQALECINFGLDAQVISAEGKDVLTDNEYFRAENVVLTGKKEFDTRGEHFDILTAFGGTKATLIYEGGTVAMTPGVSVLVPAEVGKYSVEGDLHFLRAY